MIENIIRRDKLPILPTDSAEIVALKNEMNRILDNTANVVDEIIQQLDDFEIVLERVEGNNES